MTFIKIVRIAQTFFRNYEFYKLEFLKSFWPAIVNFMMKLTLKLILVLESLFI